jgi:beta-galactosidase GanA
MVATDMAVAKGNPHLVAWMQDNELSHVNLSRCVFSEHAGRQFIAFLKERHGGDIAQLNRAWGTRFANFAEILTTRHVPTVSAGADFDDYFAFSREIVAAYARLALDVFRELDPGRLAFSNRFMHEPETLRYADLYAGFDAIALNLYPANFTYGLCPEERAFIEALHRRTGRPIMITEWSIPAVDSALYGARDKPPMDWSWNELVPSQAVRAVQAAAVTREFYDFPFVIGAHWFQYMDVDSAARKANRGIFHADKVTPWHELTTAMGEAHRDILRAHGADPTDAIAD